ncbi:MAG: stage IV sporulation protein A [Ruminococcaceae bacterium]|nr:stage IV sporulation protein A [Oscillospiraceae bacterium]
MDDNRIYRDIAERTGGDIYLGIVGPVRTGKSTLIKRFMETLVLPNITDRFRAERATDELPQSAAGRTIMTTEPKFIPEDAVEMELGQSASMRVRMIDCVGYIIPSALGYIEDNAPRMVKTPWFEEEVPFNLAAEVGTRKVINEHSTIGVVVTTDGSITDLPREEYAEVEDRVIGELKEINKPFVVLVNCVDPTLPESRELARRIGEKHNVPAVAVSCQSITEAEIREILSMVLFEFPIRSAEFNMPRWLCTLPRAHWLKQEMFALVRRSVENARRIRDADSICDEIAGGEYVVDSRVANIDLGSGRITIDVTMQPNLFYRILGEQTGLDIADDAGLLRSMLELAEIRRKYDRIAAALEEVEATGYGIVMPGIDELKLEEPEMVRQGGRYGVKLRASAPSIHMLKANITTEVAPVVGSEKQSEELVSYLLDEFEDEPGAIWQSNIFGKSLHELVNEGLHNKLFKMPPEARGKLQETIERVINEGCSGLICIIL